MTEQQIKINILKEINKMSSAKVIHPTILNIHWSYFQAMETQRIADWEKAALWKQRTLLHKDEIDRAYHIKQRDNTQSDKQRRYHEQALIEIEWLSFMMAG